MKKSVFYLLSVIILCVGMVSLILIIYFQNNNVYTYTPYEKIEDLEIEIFDAEDYNELVVTRQNLKYYATADGCVSFDDIDNLYSIYTVKATNKNCGDYVSIGENLDTSNPEVKSAVNGKVVDIVTLTDTVTLVVMNCEGYNLRTKLDISYYEQINYSTSVFLKHYNNYYPCSIEKIGYTLNDDNTFDLLIKIDDTKNNILLGEICQIFFEIGEDKNILTVENIFNGEKEIKTYLKTEKNGKTTYTEYVLKLGNAGLEHIAIASVIEEGAILYVPK